MKKIVECRMSNVESQQGRARKFVFPRHSTLGSRLAFTLIELLVVISIIAILAAFTIPVMRTVKRAQYRKTAQAELNLIATALERYHAAYNVYPPSNPNAPEINPLYYELEGMNTVSSGGMNYYQALDNSTEVLVSDYTNDFKIGGVINATHGSGEDAIAAKTFFPSLKPNNIGQYKSTLNNSTVNILVTSVGGPDQSYSTTLQTAGFTGNPFHYNSVNPTNNAGTYDLWVDLVISGQTNRISNWSSQAQIVP